jgi:hypothetical protein
MLARVLLVGSCEECLVPFSDLRDQISIGAAVAVAELICAFLDSLDERLQLTVDRWQRRAAVPATMHVPSQGFSELVQGSNRGCHRLRESTFQLSGQ